MDRRFFCENLPKLPIHERTTKWDGVSRPDTPGDVTSKQGGRTAAVGLPPPLITHPHVAMRSEDCVSLLSGMSLLAPRLAGRFTMRSVKTAPPLQPQVPTLRHWGMIRRSFPYLTFNRQQDLFHGSCDLVGSEERPDTALRAIPVCTNFRSVEIGASANV